MNTSQAHDPHAYEPFGVTADIALLTIRDGQLSILLVERAGEPYQGHWALPGGFLEPQEDAESAAWRELAEETGIDTRAAGIHLEQLRTYSAPDRDPRQRVVSVAYVAFAPDLPLPTAGSDARRARYFAVDDLDLRATGEDGLTPLAFDHAAIVADAVERARDKLEWTTLATAFLRPPFTLRELKRVFETVWGVPLVDSNFRRKVSRAEGFVIEHPSTTDATGGRPAQLYSPGRATRLEPPMVRPREDEA